jgi:ribonuclease Y
MDIVSIVVGVVVGLALGVAAGYYYKKAKVEKRDAELKTKSEGILQIAQENAKRVELQAKDDALKVIQNAETDASHRRAELAREEDRLAKRRAELDHRIERLEQREQLFNKRQSALDKRTNEVE